MNYNYEQIDGSCCTGFTGLSTSTSGQQTIEWNSTWKIAKDDNADLVKGYSFVGLTQNLENKIQDIGSIPATYTWDRTNSTAYKGESYAQAFLNTDCLTFLVTGNVCFDFITSPTKGDSTSSSAQELMLWLRYEGGQLPIGYADGPVATISGLYNKTWTLYQGTNEDSGITVNSLLVDEANQYYGSFDGDVKDWLLKLVDQGLFGQDVYVNVGNAGMEPFYGDVDLINTLALRIELA